MERIITSIARRRKALARRIRALVEKIRPSRLQSVATGFTLLNALHLFYPPCTLRLDWT